MIRVLHFVSTPAIWSGVMGVIMNYYRHLDRSKIQFDFLCFLPCEDSFEEEIRTLGGQVFFLPKPGVSPQGIGALRVMRDFFRARVKEYTWVHNHEVYVSALLSHFITRYSDGSTRLIVHCHATRYSDRRMAALRNWALCLPIAHMRCMRLACSAATGRFLYHDLLFRKQHFEIVPNAIETQRFIFDRSVREDYRALLNIRDAIVLGTIGRMVQQKNHTFLIRIFDKIHRHLPETKLLLIGNGPLAGEIRKQIQEMQLEQDILCLGERTDIPCLLQAMDLFLLPSIFEGLPISCLEAQASGLPCFLSDTITREAAWREQVHFLPLNSEELWVRECVHMIQAMKRYPEQFCRDCPKSFPDIISESRKLLRIYTKKS